MKKTNFTRLRNIFKHSFGVFELGSSVAKKKKLNFQKKTLQVTCGSTILVHNPFMEITDFINPTTLTYA